MEILASGGFDSINAENGFVGIQLAKEKSPDLIICDIKMPDFDGYGVLEELRQNPSTAMIPFIFLTAKADRAEIRQGMNLGADDYLTKPFRRMDLLETIAARLKRHSAQSQIQRRVLELQALNAQKDDLVSTITHDMRAPLTTIKVALQLMEAVPDNRRQYTEIALSACDQCDALIQNLLDLYQLESGESLAPPEPIDLQEQLAKIIASFEVRTRDCQQTFRTDLPDRLPTILYDTVSLQRIFIELLNNACKYTPSSGEIRFKVREFTTKDRQPMLRFLVANQAEIPKTDLPRIFDKFYRGVGRDRWQQGGTGLGLALVKKLIEQLQGTIYVKSKDGWTTFIVELPY
ncbi:MAG: hybrid sensor histidine kinase/response regulator [Leptolyngbyaceae cyanobacterium CSU_1_3]|nr:hybrid sensor histidine kinase/response regulator [Leptolyngbyaceae cyanobacterium CSU_1_3]